MLQFGIFISARIMHCGAQTKKDFVISFHNFHNSVRLQFVRDDQNETKMYDASKSREFMNYKEHVT